MGYNDIMTNNINSPVVLRPRATVTFEEAPDRWTPAGWHVRTTWKTTPPIDRTDGLGFLLRNRTTAERLVRAINDGVVFVDSYITHDVNGKTYVAARSLVMAKYANADLRRLGY